MVALSHLKSLQALEAAVRTRSFTLAGAELGITPAAVGQRVKTLEDYLGVELLVRGRSGVWPTPALEGALAELSAGFRALEAASDALDLQRGAELHIAAVSDFAELWLKPRLEAWRRANPNIRFVINGEGDAPVRLGPVDCVVAFGASARDHLVDLLFADHVVPVCSADNLRRTEGIDWRDRLEGFPLLHLDFWKDDPAGISWPRWISAHGLARTAPERGIRFQRATAALDAVEANAGMCLMGLSLIAGLIRSGDICLPFPISWGLRTGHMFTARWRADWHQRRHVQRFRDWLCSEAAATARDLEQLVSGGDGPGRPA
jgi:LysR family glycine cleavage system transcriptional activator